MKLMNKILAVAALMLPLSSIAATLQISAKPTTSGGVYTQYREGDDGASSIPLAFTTIPNITVENGASFTLNLASYLVQPGSPEATIVPGCSLPAGNVSYAGTTITGTSTTTVSLTCQPVASRLGFEIQYPGVFTITSVAPIGTDTLPPAIPTGLSAEAGDGQIVVSFDSVSDNHSGAATGSGVTAYNIRLGASTIATINTSPNITPALTVSNIGSISSPNTPTAGQSGNNWTLTAAGTGFEGTDDQQLFVNTAVPGDFVATVRVMTIASGDYSKAGLELRDSLDTNSIAFQCVVMRLANGTYYMTSRNRSLTAGSRATQYSAIITALPHSIRLSRTGTALSCETSVDGNTFAQVLSTSAIAMPSDAFVGMTSTSTQAGTNRVSTFENFNLSRTARLSYTHTTAVGGAYTVRAVDQIGNASDYTASVTQVPVAGANNDIKFHPGHYVWVPTGYINNFDNDFSFNSIRSFIASICSDTEIQGIKVHIRWSAAEAAQGVYTYGFSRIDTLLSDLASCNKRLMIALHERQFGGYGSDLTSFFPAYIHQGATYGTSPILIFDANANGGAGAWVNRGITTRMWQQATMDRIIDWTVAMCVRYNSHPNMEMIGMEETSLDIGPNSHGFTGASYLTQQLRWAQAARAACPNTGLRIQTNYVAALSDAAFAVWHGQVIALNITTGGSDTSPNRRFTSDRIFSGQIQGTDYRGLASHVNETQSPSLGGSLGTFTGAQLFNAGMDGYTTSSEFQRPMWSQYWVWTAQEYQGGSAQRWTTGIKPFIVTTIDGQTGNGINSTRTYPNAVPCPSNYPGCIRDEVSGTVSVTDITNNRIFQRVGTTYSLPLSGVYTGATANNVQARVMDGATEAVTWTTVDASLSGGTWSGNLTVPQGGMYTIQVRVRDSGGIPIATSSGSNTWGVGAIFAILGSSSGEYWFHTGSGSANSRFRKYNENGWASVDTTGAGVLGFANTVISSLNIPVAVMDYSVSGTTLTQWTTGGDANYAAFVAGLSAVGGKLEGVLSVVGFNDATGSTIASRAGHVTKLQTWYAQLRSSTGQATLPIFMIQAQRAEVTGSDAQFNFLRPAEFDADAADANVHIAASSIDLPVNSGDQPHLTAAGYATQGNRVGLSVTDVLGSGTYSRGPFVASVAAVNTTTTDVTLTHRGGTDFTPTSAITGFVVRDSGTIRTISAAVRQSATVIRLTHTAVSGTLTVTYQEGKNPTITGAVKDNTASTLPLEITPDAL